MTAPTQHLVKVVLKPRAIPILAILLSEILLKDVGLLSCSQNLNYHDDAERGQK